jgi:tRNA1(Val) A37 N6-methylase TrmN6
LDEIYNFKPSKEKPTIIDCGSNIGTSLLYFSKHYLAAKIIGFEADDEIAEISIKTLKETMLLIASSIKELFG